jgi:hypothetical protein
MPQTLCPEDAVSGHLRLQPTAPAAAPRHAEPALIQRQPAGRWRRPTPVGSVER